MAAPVRTSLDEIVTAGRDLLESEGVASLTMQAVAARVGVRAPSLYKRVRDRDALLALVAARAVDDLGLRLEECDETVEGVARAYRSFAHESPESFRLIISLGAEVEALERASAPVLRVAARALGEAEALDAARFLVAWATGFITMELAGAFRLGGEVEQAFEFGLARISGLLSSPR